MRAFSKNISSTSVWPLKTVLQTLMPNPISFAATKDWFLKGLEPFKFNSCKVNVKEGKCLKKDSSESLKFNSLPTLINEDW